MLTAFCCNVTFAQEVSALAKKIQPNVRASFDELAGGVYFSRTASLGVAERDERVFYSHRDGVTLSSNGTTFKLPRCDPQTLFACYQFALDADNHLALSLDLRKDVYLARAFWDTKIGLELINVDLKPWKYETPVGDTANKSIVSDERVDIILDGSKNQGTFQVAIRVGYANKNPNAEDQQDDLNWFAESFFENRAESRSFSLYPNMRRQPENGNRSSLEAMRRLANELEPAAECAAWIAFFRWVREKKVEGETEMAFSLRQPISTPKNVTDWKR